MGVEKRGPFCRSEVWETLNESENIIADLIRWQRARMRFAVSIVLRGQQRTAGRKRNELECLYYPSFPNELTHPPTSNDSFRWPLDGGADQENCGSTDQGKFSLDLQLFPLRPARGRALLRKAVGAGVDRIGNK